jgi:hypothetical protein
MSALLPKTDIRQRFEHVRLCQKQTCQLVGEFRRFVGACTLMTIDGSRVKIVNVAWPLHLLRWLSDGPHFRRVRASSLCHLGRRLRGPSDLGRRTLHRIRLRRKGIETGSALSMQFGTRIQRGLPCAHLADFLAAYNFAKRLKAPPHEYVCKICTENPDPGRFSLDPIHHTTGPANERINPKSLGLHRFLQHNASRRKCG